jgi:hypothetical protein
VIMSDVFRELIDEYQHRSKPDVPELFREVCAPGEFFYDTKQQKLFISGFDEDGQLTWFGVS